MAWVIVEFGLIILAMVGFTDHWPRLVELLLLGAAIACAGGAALASLAGFLFFSETE